MPVLSRLSQAAEGIGDGIISVDGVTPAPLVGVVGGGTRWLDAETIVYQRNDGRCWLETYSLVTGRVTPVSGEGANRIEAGGGVWAAWLAGVGYRDSLGRTHPDWYPLAVDDVSGAVAICTDYQRGAGLALIDRAGAVTIVHAGVLDRIDEGEASYRDGVLVYRAGGALVVRQPDGTEQRSTWPVAGAWHSRGWLLGWSDAHGLMCYELSGRALSISADGRDFNPDLRGLDSGLIAVASSTTAGERPQDLRRYTINPVLGTVNGVARVWIDLAAPVVVDDPPAMVPTIAPWPCRVAVFADDARNPSHHLPASVASVDDVLAFCTIPGTLEGTADAVQAAILEARRRGVPLGAYRDTVDYPPSLVPSAPGVEVVPIVMAYPWRRADGLEPIADAIARLGRTVDDLHRAGHARVAFAVAGYRQIKGDLQTYNWPLPYVLDLFGAVCALAARTAVHDLYVFAWSRADGKDGIVSRPELITLTVRLLEAALPVIDTTPEPIPDPAPTPAPDPHEDNMPKTNPTDSITYAALVAALAPRDVGRNYTDGCLDAYRAVAEGTPLATVAAGESHPTQAPLPAVPYLVWAATALGLLAIRQMAGKGTGYGDGVIDTYRRFGGERWPLEFVIADIEGAALPDRPWPSF